MATVSRYPAQVTIDLSAISDNTAALKQRAGAADLMAVVKADGYGHGLVPSAQAALRGGATWLGVAQVSEAIALRDAGITAPVLAWLHTVWTDLGPALTAGIDLGVSSEASLRAVVSAAWTTGRTARIHLKVDSGLGRNGAFGPDIEALIDAARREEANGTVKVVGIFQHFAYADSPEHPTVATQLERFDTAIAYAERAGCRFDVRHAANSAATLTNPRAAYDMVRPGLAIYGLSPVPELGAPETFGLRPAMRLSAEIAIVKRVPANTGVSYAHTYTTSAPTSLVDVPVGYSDGIPRGGSNTGPVLVGGRRFTVAGRVCMDQFMVDVGDLVVDEGAQVVLFGAGTGGEPTAQEWAEAAGTISYEIVTRIGPRIPKVYLGG